jgi:hypothetical protein
LKCTQLLGATAFALCIVSTQSAFAGPSPAPAPASPVGTTTTSTTTTTARPNEKSSSTGSGSVDVGVLGGVGFPRPLAVEGLLKLDKVFAIGVEYSALPTITVSGVQASMWAIAGDARVFPFKNGFFFGMSAGRQHLGEYATASVSHVGNVSATQSVDTTFLNPRIGFLWNWGAFALGMDAGVQIPVSSTVTSTIPPSVTPPPEVQSLTHAFGQGVLPTVDLLRIGLLM